MSDPDHTSGAVLEEETTVTDEAIETRWLVDGGRTTAHSDDSGDEVGDDSGDDSGDDAGDDSGDASDPADSGDDSGDASDAADSGDDSGGSDA